MKLTLWGMMILLLSPLGIASARQQESSLAEAARTAREQKKDQPKAAKVWDNETISQTTGHISVVGQTPAPAPSPEAGATKPAAAEGEAAAAGEEKAPGKPAENKSAIEAELAAAKDQLASLRIDLDIMQRKYTLDQQAFYAKADYASDRAGAAALQDEKGQIDAKQQEIADAQRKIDELQEKLKPGAEGADKSS